MIAFLRVAPGIAVLLTILFIIPAYCLGYLVYRWNNPRLPARVIIKETPDHIKRTPLSEDFVGETGEAFARVENAKRYYKVLCDSDGVEVWAHYHELEWVTR